VQLICALESAKPGPDTQPNGGSRLFLSTVLNRQQTSHCWRR